MTKQKYKIRKGDTVKVITGADRGKIGEVLKVLIKEKKVLLDGVNLVKKHRKPDDEGGGIVIKSMPVHISNVSLFHEDNCTKIGYKFMKDRKKVRFAKKSGKMLDK